MRKPTIYEALHKKLGREPSNAELKADVQRILTEGTQEMASKGKLRHQRRRNPKPRKRIKNLRDRRGAVPGATGGNWVVTATKKRTGSRYYYAGGARLASEEKFAARFASAIHASRVKDTILKDFPTKLTGAYYWQSWPLAA